MGSPDDNVAVVSSLVSAATRVPVSRALSQMRTQVSVQLLQGPACGQQQGSSMAMLPPRGLQALWRTAPISPSLAAAFRVAETQRGLGLASGGAGNASFLRADELCHVNRSANTRRLFN